MSAYCTGGGKRVKLSETQRFERKAPCPRCARVLNVVPNNREMKATIPQHLPALDQPGPSVK